MRRTSSITPARVVPVRSPRSLARLIVGPSATGSLNGTPNSITSAPASAAASTIFSVAAREGSPAVMYATRPISPASESARKRCAMRPAGFGGATAVCDEAKFSDIARENIHIFIAAAGKIQDYEFVLLHTRRAANQFRQRVRRFQRGNNSFLARECACGFHGSRIAHRAIFRAALFGEPGVLRADAGIIQTRGHGMSRGNLAVGGLQNVGVSSLQNSWPRAAETAGCCQSRCVFAKSGAAPARLYADHFHGAIGQERVKQSNRIRTTADASDQSVR